jgi:hypothetical protein
MNAHLRHDHELLLKSLLEGKLPRNLQWKDVIDLIGQIGEVEHHGSDEFAFVVGPHRELFKHPHTHTLDVEAVSRLRKFLRLAEVASSDGDAKPTDRVVVVVDHHGAHIYKDAGQSTPEEEAKVTPYDPFNFQHHLIHRKEAHYRGERVPEESSFYEGIAKHLADAKEIVLIGHGTGQSSAVDYLAEYLKSHHSTIFENVIATEKADLSALSGPEIEEIAKKHLHSPERRQPTTTDRYDRPHKAAEKAS